MCRTVTMIGFSVIGVLAMSATEVNAYNYTGTGTTTQCVNPPGDTTPINPFRCSFHKQWELVGGQQPGSIAIIENVYSVTTAALVCVNPGTGRKDVRIGVGGITFITVNPETAFAFDDRGRFVLNETIPTAVPEFEVLFPGSGQAEFEAFYRVSNLDCRNSNWLPFEYYYGNHTASGTIFRDCTDPADPDTCTKQDDNVLYSCAPNVAFKNYAKVEQVVFTCQCIQSCKGIE